MFSVRYELIYCLGEIQGSEVECVNRTVGCASGNHKVLELVWSK